MSKLDSIKIILNQLIERTRNVSIPDTFPLENELETLLNDTKSISKIQK